MSFDNTDTNERVRQIRKREARIAARDQMKCKIGQDLLTQEWKIKEFDGKIWIDWAGSWRSQANAERAIVVESMARSVKRYEWTIEK